MTQKQRIVNSLINGKLTTLTAALRGMGVKLPSRIGELEKELEIRFNRKKVTQNGDYYFEYSAQKKDLKTLKNYLKSK